MFHAVEDDLFPTPCEVPLFVGLAHFYKYLQMFSLVQMYLQFFYSAVYLELIAMFCVWNFL